MFNPPPQSNSAFPKSNSETRGDRFSTSSTFLLILLVSFFILGIWLFVGRIRFEASSQNAMVETSQQVVRATFRPRNIANVQIGEIGTIDYEVDGEVVSVEVTIASIVDETGGVVDLLVLDPTAFGSLFYEEGSIAEVRLTTRAVSPIRFIITNAGLTQ